MFYDFFAMINLDLRLDIFFLSNGDGIHPFSPTEIYIFIIKNDFQPALYFYLEYSHLLITMFLIIMREINMCISQYP